MGDKLTQRSKMVSISAKQVALIFLPASS